MSKILKVSLILLSSLFVSLPVVLADDTASVSATVTAQNVSVTVTDGTIAYGIIPANTSKSTISTDLNDQQTATNEGNVAEDINIKGMDSTAWTLSATTDANDYVHKFCTTSCTTPPTGYTALTTNYQTLKSDLATSGTQVFDLQITTPTSTSTYDPQTVDVTVQAVAHS
ncbi:hypothetical protein M0R04_01040 [Candidatus Dojkabacteria bacterium]|jgi:hypothetical protein|nr:hypothetical protein [Candidatus Dojkabacteria bacterium]